MKNIYIVYKKKKKIQQKTTHKLVELKKKYFELINK